MAPVHCILGIVSQVQYRLGLNAENILALQLATRSQEGSSLSRYNMVLPTHIVSEAKEVLRDKDIKTYGQFKTKLAAVLGVTVDELKQHKASLQDIIAQEAQKESTASDEERQQQQEESEASQQAEDSEEEEESSKAMAALRAMARAMSLGCVSPYEGVLLYSYICGASTSRFVVEFEFSPRF